MTVSRIIGVVGVTFVASCLSTPPASDPDAPPATPCVSGFEGGTTDGTRPLGTGNIGLATGATMGYWTTRVFPAPPNGRFRTLHWKTVRPSLKALPDARGRETTYLQGSADLATNQLLFHFDDPPAWDDTSGNDFTATCLTSPQNQCPTPMPGIFRDAIDFDVDADPQSTNDNDRIRILNDPALEPTTGTVEVWVKPNRAAAQGTRMMIVHKGSANPSQPPFATYSIEYSELSTFRCYANISSAGTDDFIDGTHTAAPEQWHHVACTYDGSALRMFVDGDADGELPAAGVLDYNLTGSPDLILGDYNGSQFLDGQVDELAVHSSVLSPAVLRERARRGALRLAWQVRVCDDPACDGEDSAWVGPNGTAATMYTEACSTELDHPTLLLSNLDCDGDGEEDDGFDLAVPDGAYLQARALFSTHRAMDTPELIEYELCE